MAFFQACVLLVWGLAALGIFAWHRARVVRPVQWLLALITVTLPCGILNLIPVEGGQCWPHLFLPQGEMTTAVVIKHLLIALIMMGVGAVLLTLALAMGHMKRSGSTLVESFAWLKTVPWRPYYLGLMVFGLLWGMLLNLLCWWPHLLEKLDGDFWWWVPFLLLTFFSAMFPFIREADPESEEL